MIGKTLGHYQIAEKIGEGGMGVVYRAHDEYLDRDVALKVLPTGTLTDRSSQKRLRREAQALSRLNHPNIETLFELSTSDDAEFLAVEYIRGVTLSDMLEKGALPEKDIAHLGAQLATGLVAAHEQKVLHCDLKPRNLRVTADGRLKILDFGIAKLLKATIESSASGSTPDSSSGHLGAAGTLPYMSPEQVRCETLDARSDIYATGAVLYEMATGERPFREEASSRLIDAILHQPAVPPRARNARISPELERIILKCLEKDPENRYQTARELEVDLRQLAAPNTTKWLPASERAGFWRPKTAFAVILALALAGILLAFNVGGWWDRLIGTGSVGRIESLAVLPLENLSKDPEQEYFADGMTEELITTLGKIRALRVISRTSVMMYKGIKKDLPTIARELHVDAVVEGSVLRSGNRVRITAQLIQAKADRHLWAESYERGLTDVLALQSEVARAIVEQIRIKLSPQEEGRLLTARGVQMDAYDAYLQGRYFWNKRDRESVMTGLKYFQQAIELDPNYALAYTGVADSYLIISNNYWLPPSEVFPKAKAAALKALQIDDTLAEVHTSMILVKELEWDWKGAEIEARRALDLNPGYATAHQWYSALLTLTARHDEAIAEVRRAAELDPLSAIIALNGAHSYYYARRFSHARQGIQRTLQISPGFRVQYDLGAIDLVDGRIPETVAQLQAAVTLFPDDESIRALLGYAYARSGRQGEARALLNELKRDSKGRYISPCFFALVSVGLGKENEALEWLEDAYRQRDRSLPWFGVDPLFDPLRLDPRFRDLLRRMNLPRMGA